MSTMGHNESSQWPQKVKRNRTTTSLHVHTKYNSTSPFSPPQVPRAFTTDKTSREPDTISDFVTEVRLTDPQHKQHAATLSSPLIQTQHSQAIAVVHKADCFVHSARSVSNRGGTVQKYCAPGSRKSHAPIAGNHIILLEATTLQHTKRFFCFRFSLSFSFFFLWSVLHITPYKRRVARKVTTHVYNTAQWFD